MFPASSDSSDQEFDFKAPLEITKNKLLKYKEQFRSGADNRIRILKVVDDPSGPLEVIYYKKNGQIFLQSIKAGENFEKGEINKAKKELNDLLILSMALKNELYQALANKEENSDKQKYSQRLEQYLELERLILKFTHPVKKEMPNMLKDLNALREKARKIANDFKSQENISQIHKNHINPDQEVGKTVSIPEIENLASIITAQRFIDEVNKELEHSKSMEQPFLDPSKANDHSHEFNQGIDEIFGDLTKLNHVMRSNLVFNLKLQDSTKNGSSIGEILLQAFLNFRKNKPNNSHEESGDFPPDHKLLDTNNFLYSQAKKLIKKISDTCKKTDEFKGQIASELPAELTAELTAHLKEFSKLIKPQFLGNFYEDSLFALSYSAVDPEVIKLVEDNLIKEVYDDVGLVRSEHQSVGFVAQDSLIRRVMDEQYSNSDEAGQNDFSDKVINRILIKRSIERELTSLLKGGKEPKIQWADDIEIVLERGHAVANQILTDDNGIKSKKEIDILANDLPERRPNQETWASWGYRLAGDELRKVSGTGRTVG